MTQNEQISQIINNARTAFEKWKKKDIPERCAHLSRLAKLLKKNREQYAKIITEEMGKPITQSYAEIDK